MKDELPVLCDIPYIITTASGHLSQNSSFLHNSKSMFLDFPADFMGGPGQVSAIPFKRGAKAGVLQPSESQSTFEISEATSSVSFESIASNRFS
jgi:hypothetical protein